MTNLERFMRLFSGSENSHGFWDDVRGAKTIREPASVEDYELHLAGRDGLGIVPVNQKGLCTFGAIDIDIDTINHKNLQQRVSQNELPLIVCRSKSGGAHLYVFLKSPGLDAAKVISSLKKWAALLGYGKSEIFRIHVLQMF